MTTIPRLLLCLFTLTLGACYPVERFWWSPDGAQAVVVAGDKAQFHLTRPGGDLGNPLASVQAGDDLPVGVSWLPDNSGFVLHRVHARATWGEARALLPNDEAAVVERYAKAIPHLLHAAAAVAGEADALDALLSAFAVRDNTVMAAAFFCAREKQKAAIDAAVLAGAKGAEILAKVETETTPFQVHEICLFKVSNGEVTGEPQPITRSIHPVVLPKASPKFPAVAYWKILNDDKPAALEVSTLDGKTRIQAGQSSSVTFDWTPDGRSVVLAAPVAEEDRLVQLIRRVTVLHESGEMIAQDHESTELAVAVMPTPARLCVLPDARVLFASQPAKLPAASGALDLEPRLFLASADGKSVSEVPTASGDLPTNLSFFVASPDGKRVAVVESDTVAVAVVELATGKTEIVSAARPGWSCRTMPAWKSATELTFAALDEAKREPKWMLWKQGEGVRSINASWPATATSTWLDEKKDPAAPAKDTP